MAHRSDDNIRINFNGFGHQVAKMYLADISFNAGGSLGVLAAGEAIETQSLTSNYRALG